MSEASLWYKDAIIYQLHVRAFYDSDGDGIGDFVGLRRRLDYIQDLGVTAIWLLPFYPSPLRDDGYDIADYTDVNPLYGTLDTFRAFLDESHQRGLRVVTELVLNHTSDQHPWFQAARAAPAGSPEREMYVWSDRPDRYEDARIIFSDHETSNWAWDPVARAYYWHRFYAHQPDLNFDNPAVHEALIAALDFWLDMGVDGMRLDAVPYLYEREGTSCENLPETHDMLRKLRAHVDSKYEDRMLLAEANQWPEDAAAYFGNDDECHMAFHFPLMPRMYMSLEMEDRHPVIDILEQTPAIPPKSQWAVFLRNHDELTLEMVTDEERDYMYRVYASETGARINLGIRRRLAPLMGNNRRKIELLNGLLMSLPGTPIVYYGDEIGMGDNIYLGDRDGVRTPLQWSADRNAGFSQTNPQRLYLPIIIDPEYHYETVNVQTQQSNPQSFLWWTKRMISLRKRFQAFGRGTLQFFHPANRNVLSFVREYEGECILIVANLSRYAQCVELDLAGYKGRVPVELFGHTAFPPIGDLPYFITLGPHGFYWFSLESTRESEERESPTPTEALMTLTVTGSWHDIFTGRNRKELERRLPAYLRRSRWFGGKARSISNVEFEEIIPIPRAGGNGAEIGPTPPRVVAYLTIVRVDYREGDAEYYALPLAFATPESRESGRDEGPSGTLLQVRVRPTPRGDVSDIREETSGFVYDAIRHREFQLAMLDLISESRRTSGLVGELSGERTGVTPVRDIIESGAEPMLLRAEQSNNSIVFGDKLILKVIRRLDEGVNPDFEIGRQLTRYTAFAHVPALVGGLHYRVGKRPPRTVALLHEFSPNEGDAWKYTLAWLKRYVERQRASGCDIEPVDAPLVTLSDAPLSDVCQEIMGTYLEFARLLGERTAEMHIALAGLTDPAFRPDPYMSHYQRSLYQSMRNLVIHTIDNLSRKLGEVPREIRDTAKSLISDRSRFFERFAFLRGPTLRAKRIRVHGDYHLGQVLYTGKDVVIIDFEGEPARRISERRFKRSPLRDVAGMLRSFDYASWAALQSEIGSFDQETPQYDEILGWVRMWSLWTSVAYLQGYRLRIRSTDLLPERTSDLQSMLDAFLLEKVLYELNYELNHRPDWLPIPIFGVRELISKQSPSGVRI